MQKTANKAKSSSSYVRPKLQRSTTLSRKYVRRPTAKKTMDISRPSKKVTIKVSEKASVESSVKAPAKISAKAPSKVSVKAPAKTKIDVKEDKNENASFKTKAKASELKKAISISSKHAPIKINKVERANLIKRFNSTPVEKKVAPAVDKSVKRSAKTVKSASASKASSDAARLAMKKVATMDSATRPMKKRRKAGFFIALSCSVMAVIGLATFVVLNIPNVSVKVAAIQTGIDAKYPDFVPRGYSMETVSADKDNKVTMKFVGPNDAYFVLTEENSTWDSAAVLNNYVKLNYSSNYSTMHEQGITYYSDSGSAVWVNGGILYKLTSYGKNLTREQIRNLVVSL